MYIYDKKNNTLEPSYDYSQEGIGFNAIGDMHLDFYIGIYEKRFRNPYRAYAIMMVFHTRVKEDLLLICGDISDRNRHTIRLLEELSRLWKTILVIPGNHEWYHQDKDEDNRYMDLINSIQGLGLENIHFLGDTIDIYEYQGLKIAGSMMMYDISSLSAKLVFRYTVADSSFLSEEFVRKQHDIDVDYYNKYIDNVDIFMSHVSLIQIGKSRANKMDFYLNKSVEPRPGVLYLHGHVHHRDYYSKDGITAINVASGLPIGQGIDLNPVITSIKVKM